jgi:hypothetical protein
MQLSQVIYDTNSVDKILINKIPDGARSPNLADAVMIAFGRPSRAMENWR